MGGSDLKPVLALDLLKFDAASGVFDHGGVFFPFQVKVHIQHRDRRPEIKISSANTGDAITVHDHFSNVDASKCKK